MTGMGDRAQALQDRYGGWTGAGIVDDFANYAATVFTSLGEKIKYYTTFNEPWSFCFQGYGTGVQAPGVTVGTATRSRPASLASATLVGSRQCVCVDCVRRWRFTRHARRHTVYSAQCVLSRGPPFFFSSYAEPQGCITLSWVVKTQEPPMQKCQQFAAKSKPYPSGSRPVHRETVFLSIR